MTPRPLLSLPALLILGACAVGPDYAPPQTTVAPAWTSPTAPGAALTGAWWQELNDPQLDALIAQMRAGNPSLREAQARLAEVRAMRDATAGGKLPALDARASGNENLLSRNGQLPIGNIPGFARDFPLFDLGFDASWEIDLWGKQKRKLEAARARTESAELQVEAQTLQLTAELARAYVDLRLAQRQVGLAGEALAARTALADLTDLRQRQGEATRLEAERTRGEAETQQAAAREAEAAAQAALMRLATLVGVRPDALPATLAQPAPIPAPPATIAAGLPADLLRRRPDIAGAERDLAAATADIGVAKADLLPKLSLSLSLGQQARAISDLASSDSTRATGGAGLVWPIFHGGALRAMVRAADARAEAAVARYDAAVIGALADSETAINRYDRARAALDAAERAAGREAAALSLARKRFEAGEDDRLSLARARLSAIAAGQRADQARAAATSAAIALYKALGGGWSGRA